MARLAASRLASRRACGLPRIGVAVVALLPLAGCGLRGLAPEADPAAVLRVDHFNCLINHSTKRVTIVGEVKNVGERRVAAALLVASLRTPTGRVKGYGDTVVRNVPPGGTKPFKIVSRYRGAIAPKPKNIEILVFDPPPD
jgi:hypothetical protein